ncbi:hypothetical protein [Nitratireductor sp. StC3]|uniref:hypothetical protein n=1 Tax=Nitratireductor sp. StC3 TaxID=2126741 RepID=UPI000D0CF719|nr:hypothetical protein [Nitratireductor sp. StC3]PSM19857.1 hypothetical protein C7T96_01950 [Nitratireductor sp. StC3]
MKLAFVAVLAPLSVTACAATPPVVLPAYNAADPAMGVRETSYRPVVGDYHHRQPVGPQDWRRLNERLSPASKGAGS